MPNQKLTTNIAAIQAKLGIFGSLPQLEVGNQCVFVIPLNTFGFFTSPFTVQSATSPNAVGSVQRFRVPTNKIWRVIAASMYNLTGTWLDADISIGNPANSTFGELTMYPGLGSTTTLVVQREFLVPGGYSVTFNADYAVAQTYACQICYFEEESGIAPTG